MKYSSNLIKIFLCADAAADYIALFLLLKKTLLQIYFVEENHKEKLHLKNIL